MIFILLPIVWFLPSFLPHFDLCILQITCYRRDKMSPSSSSFSLSPSSSSSSPIRRSPINIQPEENFHHLVKPFLCVSSFKILEICGSNVFPNCKMLCNILVFYAEYFTTHLLPMHINVKQVKMSKLEPQLPCRVRWSCLAPVWIRCLCKPSLPSPKNAHPLFYKWNVYWILLFTVGVYFSNGHFKLVHPLDHLAHSSVVNILKISNTYSKQVQRARVANGIIFTFIKG